MQMVATISTLPSTVCGTTSPKPTVVRVVTTCAGRREGGGGAGWREGGGVEGSRGRIARGAPCHSSGDRWARRQRGGRWRQPMPAGAAPMLR
jgi:hypothetical protein